MRQDTAPVLPPRTGERTSHLENIRRYELDRSADWLQPDARVLELGAGTGWQAKLLAQYGLSVQAIDVTTNPPDRRSYWPVEKYDGFHIPFPDDSFDLIFSSNVLEHIKHVIAFQEEIHRVLTPNGTAIHILPSTSWRLWTSIAHYPFLLMTALRSTTVLGPSKKNGQDREILKRAKRYTPFERIRRVLYSVRHGERGTTLTEYYLFSRSAWKRLFRNTGWTVESCKPTRLFYTGYEIFGARLSLRTRTLASRFLGSSTNIYVLKERCKAPSPESLTT